MFLIYKNNPYDLLKMLTKIIQQLSSLSTTLLCI